MKCRVVLSNAIQAEGTEREVVQPFWMQFVKYIFEKALKNTWLIIYSLFFKHIFK